MQRSASSKHNSNKNKSNKGDYVSIAPAQVDWLIIENFFAGQSLWFLPITILPS